MRPSLSLDLAEIVILAGLIISLWITTLQLSAIGTRSEKVQEFRSMLLKRALKDPAPGTSNGSDDSITFAEILDTAQNITDIGGTIYENADQSFDRGVRVSSEIDAALRSKQSESIHQLGGIIYLTLPLICLLIWRLCFRRPVAPPAKNTVALGADAERAIQELGTGVGKLHQSMMKSIMLSANTVQSPFIHSPSALGILRDDYSIVYANKALSQLTKSPLSELIGKSIVEFVKCQRGDLPSLPLPLYDLEAVVVDRNGTTIAVEVSISHYEGPKRSGLVISIMEQRSPLLHVRFLSLMIA